MTRETPVLLLNVADRTGELVNRPGHLLRSDHRRWGKKDASPAVPDATLHGINEESALEIGRTHPG
jgi:hypothetical protein